MRSVGSSQRDFQFPAGVLTNMCRVRESASLHAQLEASRACQPSSPQRGPAKVQNILQKGNMSRLVSPSLEAKQTLLS